MVTPSTLLSGVAIFGNLLKWLKLGGAKIYLLADYYVLK
jgi:hypothetical protein